MKNKDLKIFLGIAFIIPYLMGIFMFIAKKMGNDINIYAILQMYTPALIVFLPFVFSKYIKNRDFIIDDAVKNLECSLSK